MYAIGKLAKMSNITVRTLRYYDQIGLLKPTEAKDGGHRYIVAATTYYNQQVINHE